MGGAYAWDKNTSARLCAKKAGGAHARGGGVFAGHYGNLNKISATYIVDTRASTNLLIDSI